MNKNNCFTIVIEGVDGSGKETQTNALREPLSKLGTVYKFSFPNYDCISGSMIQSYLNGEWKSRSTPGTKEYIEEISDIYLLNRVESASMKQLNDGPSINEIMNNPKYQSDSILLFDRYATSNILHQAGQLNTEKEILEYIERMEKREYETYNLPKPNLVIYLDIPDHIIARNLSARNDNKHGGVDIHESSEHTSKIRKNKDFIIKNQHWEVVDCYCPETDQMYEKEVITRMILSKVLKHIGTIGGKEK